MPAGNPSRRWFIAALVAGAIIRAAALPLPGTHDTVPWKIWSYNAAREGVSRLYGVGGSPPDHRVITYLNAETTVNYPPLALHELGLSGRVYAGSITGSFRTRPRSSSRSRPRRHRGRRVRGSACSPS
jgi:hypothetical protein